MSRRSSGRDSAPFHAAQRKFDRWRETRRPSSRIPEPLWKSAVDLARSHGASRTCRELRLDYYALKKRLDPVSGSASASRARSERPSRFVELPLAVSPSKRECAFELQNDRGAALRIELLGLSPEEMVTVARGLWDQIQ